MHLASPASPRAPLANPIHTLKVGSIGKLNALGIAKAAGTRFVLASTSEVYGDPEVNPQPESYSGHVSTTGPRAVYDESMRVAEALALAYRREHDVGPVIARIVSTRGPRMGPGDGRVVSTFVAQALAGEPLTVHGDGTQTRSLCYVDDLVDGLVRLSEIDEELPVNLGNPDERTIVDVAGAVIAATGSRSQIRFGPALQDDPRRRCPASRGRGAAELGAEGVIGGRARSHGGVDTSARSRPRPGRIRRSRLELPQLRPRPGRGGRLRQRRSPRATGVGRDDRVAMRRGLCDGRVGKTTRAQGRGVRMTHETTPGEDMWDKLGPADAITAAPLDDEPVGADDLDDDDLDDDFDFDDELQDVEPPEAGGPGGR